MSEKRFEFYSDEYLIGVLDTVTGRTLNSFEIVDKLNEQQGTIQLLQNEIDELKKDIDIYEYEEKKHSETVRKLYEENKKLGKELKELENNYKDLLYDGGFDE